MRFPCKKNGKRLSPFLPKRLPYSVLLMGSNLHGKRSIQWSVSNEPHREDLFKFRYNRCITSSTVLSPL